MNLSAENISYHIANKQLLNNISVPIQPGSITAILGANGAGKTTLLRILTGELMPGSGYVNLNRRRLKSWKTQELAKLRAVLTQEVLVNFTFTALEIVLMGRSPYYQHTPSRLDKEIAQAALEETDTYHLAQRNYMTLSGGERQRVQLARVLAQVWTPVQSQPQYLLLDEPSSALDLEHQHSLMHTLKKFSDKGYGIGIILHDLNLAAQYVDKALIIKNGEFVAYGDIKTTFTNAIISNAFNLHATVISDDASERIYIACGL